MTLTYGYGYGYGYGHGWKTTSVMPWIDSAGGGPTRPCICMQDARGTNRTLSIHRSCSIPGHWYRCAGNGDTVLSKFAIASARTRLPPFHAQARGQYLDTFLQVSDPMSPLNFGRLKKKRSIYPIITDSQRTQTKQMQSRTRMIETSRPCQEPGRRGTSDNQGDLYNNHTKWQQQSQAFRVPFFFPFPFLPKLPATFCRPMPKILRYSTVPFEGREIFLNTARAKMSLALAN